LANEHERPKAWPVKTLEVKFAIKTAIEWQEWRGPKYKKKQLIFEPLILKRNNLPVL
jgi:hypothetical protein